ncbi:MAG: hypothetical protein HN348_21985 [Proteobacteria bacterium]|nr:hypothetical protein [Pseudomonadota bacterium]
MSNEYQAEDRSLLTPLLYRVLWGPMVSHLPQSISPNALTLAGQFCAFVALVAATIDAFGSSIQLAIVAIGAFAYLTLDCIDGSHARRTGQTSRLGEFLDHWLDGISGGVIVAAFALSLDASWWAAAIAMGGVMMNYGTTFLEQRTTGIVRFSFLSSTEAIVTGATVCVIVAVLGLPQPIIDALFAMGGAAALSSSLVAWYRVGGGPSVLEEAVAMALIVSVVGLGKMEPQAGLAAMMCVGHATGGAMIVERFTGYRRPTGLVIAITLSVVAGWWVHALAAGLGGLFIWLALSITDLRRVLDTIK